MTGLRLQISGKNLEHHMVKGPSHDIVSGACDVGTIITSDVKLDPLAQRVSARFDHSEVTLFPSHTPLFRSGSQSPGNTHG